MDKEELINNIKLIWMKENPHINVTKTDIEFGLEFAKLGIRYGFEKARLKAKKGIGMDLWPIWGDHYDSAEEVLAELDKEQEK